MLMTMGDVHSKYDPPPLMGISRKMTAMDDERTPA